MRGIPEERGCRAEVETPRNTPRNNCMRAL
jgi:hypothetical protein